MNGQISQKIGDKIDRVNSIRITKSINLLSFCAVLGSVGVHGRLYGVGVEKTNRPLQSIYWESVAGATIIVNSQPLSEKVMP